jgi:hypothetical protein
MTSVGSVKHESAALHSPSMTRSTLRPGVLRAVSGVALAALLIGACGGDDDDAGATPTSVTTPQAVVTLAPTTDAPVPVVTEPTTPATSPPLELVTDGATVIVANASGINGAAGRMTDELALAGFTTGAAANSTESQLFTTKIYYNPDNANAKAVADSVREGLGGGDITVLELTVPAPLTDPDALGDAAVLVAMGNDVADKTLDELQGGVVVTDEATSEGSTDG